MNTINYALSVFLVFALNLPLVGQTNMDKFLSKTYIKIQFAPEVRSFDLPQISEEKGKNISQFGIEPKIGLSYRSLPIFEYGQYIKIETSSDDEVLDNSLIFSGKGIKNQSIHIGTGLLYGLLGNGATKGSTFFKYLLSSIEYKNISTGVNNAPIKVNNRVLLKYIGTDNLIESDNFFAVNSKFSNKSFYVTLRPTAYINIFKHNDPYFNDKYRGGLTFAVGYYQQKLQGFTDNFLYSTTSTINTKKYTNVYYNKYSTNGLFIGGGYEFDEGEKGGIKTTIGFLKPLNQSIFDENGVDVINNQLSNLEGYDLPGGYFSMRAVMKSGYFAYGVNMEGFILFGKSSEYKWDDKNTEYFLQSGNFIMNLSFSWNIPIKKKKIN